MGEWESIETAPDDGVWFLAYWKGMPISMYPATVFWDGDEHRDSWVMPSNFEYGEVFPTHWMPLPAPPEPTT